MAPLTRIRVQAGSLSAVVASLIRETRHAIGWSQDELAARAGTSQTKVWRIERGDAGALDLQTLDRLFAALGLRPTLEIEGRHLADRADQRDPVHAALASAVAGRLTRCGWETASEVPTGSASPTGWIDLLAYRERDSALAIVEIKADLPDVGGLQRQVTWYEREAPRAAWRLGWRPERIVVIVVCLDTDAIAQQLRDHQRLLEATFPGNVRVLSEWLRDPAAPAPDPGQRTLVMTDLAPHRALAFSPSALRGRRTAAAYRNYADAAARLAARRLSGHSGGVRPSRADAAGRISEPRPRAGPPRSRPSSSRSRAP